ncbi:hypothetical protein CRM89_01405 [Nocardia sp. FDAARGOS_372]|nr:hypothetical protein CRM89_01405 [Nocardia sp. FDAARGOS_372]
MVAGHSTQSSCGTAESATAQPRRWLPTVDRPATRVPVRSAHSVADRIMAGVAAEAASAGRTIPT